mmetsp:Transcript_6559/g.8215  ORF Transcript_6559/g.8215 Transcript_6559/m.8215 type:complete len:91 (-) Transcript_6559:57-329(-)
MMLYPQMLEFEQHAHGMKFNASYKTRSWGQILLQYLGKAFAEALIADRIKSGEYHHYSLLMDGSSYNAEEKEIVIMKNSDNGRPVFNVLL